MTNRSRVLRLATRSSLQAKTQAQFIADSIRAHRPEIDVELVFVDTTGDQRADVPLHQIGGQGVFVKEVQQAVLDGRADVAVHSAKDLPSENVAGLTIAAFTERRSPHDALIGRSLDELALGATVATGSVRRRAQIAALRPDLSFVELRGNIPTRLEKIPVDGAIVMAVAALEVLGLTDRIAQVLDIELCVPMVGQGCVAVEARTDDAVVRDVLRTIDHSVTRRAVEAERAFLAELGAGCSLPVAAHLDDQGVFHAFMARDGEVVQLAGSIGVSDDHKVVGAGIAHECRRRLRAR
ncbi:MAG: porphobilinogen deaminase [Actinomycetota bacterium]|jgi:hydroxymethylbilane synthase